jgi:hypothetical protein
MRSRPRFISMIACVIATAVWLSLLIPGYLGTLLCGASGVLWALVWKPWK